MEREAQCATIAELEHAVSRIADEKESATNLLASENAVLRNELKGAQIAAADTDKTKIDELNKSLYYYKKRSRDLARMLKATEQVKQCGRTGEAGSAENETRDKAVPPRVTIPRPPVEQHPLDSPAMDSPDRPKSTGVTGDTEIDINTLDPNTRRRKTGPKSSAKNRVDSDGGRRNTYVID